MGHAAMHAPHLMQSESATTPLSANLLIAMPIGQTLSQARQPTQVSLIRSGALPAPAHFESVPMGQNAHQLRGWKMTPSAMPTSVVAVRKVTRGDAVKEDRARRHP